MTTEANLDDRRRAALDTVEKSEREVRGRLILTAVFEGALLIAVVLLMDWGDRLHLLMFLLACLVYGSLGLGLVTLAAYLKLNTLRVLAAIELLDR